MKMEIEFDIERIRTDRLYSIDDFIRYIDALFERYHLIKLKDGVYEGSRSEHDFAHFGKVILKLKKEVWFMKYASRWLLYTGDSIEDVLLHYQNKAAQVK